jgi:hypothetical protein
MQPALRCWVTALVSLPFASACAPSPAPTTPAAQSAAPTATSPTSPPPADPPATANAAPASVAECKAKLATSSAADTDATVTPGPESGKSERFAGIVETMKQKRGAFRCCFELWAKDNPRRDARVTLKLTLDANGSATEAEVVRAESDDAPVMEACVIELARAVAFPRSNSAKLTTFEYELGFKHHKAPTR